MRMISVTKSEYGTKRLMLVNNPQINKRECDVVCYMYYGEGDGPCEGSQLYYAASIEDVIKHLEDECGVERSEWSQIPDQLSGCLDEWVAPVRAYVSDTGNVVPGEFERFGDGKWVRFNRK